MILDFLARDIAVWGALQAPILSWLGSLGLLLFFGWQATRLLLDVSRAALPFFHVRPVLTALAHEAEASDLRDACDRAFSDGHEPPPGRPAVPGPTDLDRVRKLDQAMRDAGALRRAWVQFRKTLLIEHVPWVTEPRVFTTRQADEFFTQEAVLGRDIDLAFYAQVPSLIIGFGLLLTFVTICMGLSRLHADGDTIVGIQGLINGLAGKFLTSIVGLVCANLFVLIERPVVRRLLALHVDCVTLVNESFPRRTVEDLVDALARAKSREAATPEPRADGTDRVAREVEARLAVPITELTTAVRGLSEHVEESRGIARALTAALLALDAHAVDGRPPRRSERATAASPRVRTNGTAPAEPSLG